MRRKERCRVGRYSSVVSWGREASGLPTSTYPLHYDVCVCGSCLTVPPSMILPRPPHLTPFYPPSSINGAGILPELTVLHVDHWLLIAFYLYHHGSSNRLPPSRSASRRQHRALYMHQCSSLYEASCDTPGFSGLSVRRACDSISTTSTEQDIDKGRSSTLQWQSRG